MEYFWESSIAPNAKLKRLSSKNSPYLPIMDALAKSFFNKWSSHPCLMQPEKEAAADKTVPEIFFSVANKFKFEGDYSSWTNPYRVGFPIDNDYKAFFDVPLIMEFLILFDSVSKMYKGERSQNTEFVKLKDSYDRSIRTKHTKSVDPTALFRRRLMEFQLIPLFFSTENSKTHNSLKEHDVVLAFNGNLMSLLPFAWAELYQANLLNMPVSLCTFCGSIYRLGGKKKGRGFSKSTCGKEKCLKTFRLQRDRENRKCNPDEERKKGRERQQKRRARQAVLLGESTIEEQAKKMSRDPRLIQQWVDEYKAKQKRKG